MGTIIVRILVLALTIGIIVNIIVIVGVVVMTIVGTIFPFRDGPVVCINPVYPGPGKPAGANVRSARD